MAAFKGVIFDLDGTLLNTIWDLSDSVNAMLEQFGFPTHSYEVYKQKIGHGFRNLVEVSLPPEKADEAMIDRGLKCFLAEYDRRYHNKTAPYDGVRTLLEDLSRSGVLLAVNSNKRNDYTRTLIDGFFGDLSLTAVFGERPGVPKKPDPATALEIAEMMNAAPAEVAYVGDSNTDIQTGKNAGMTTIGVSWGFRGRAELEQSGSDFVVDRPEQIFEILTGKRENN